MADDIEYTVTWSEEDQEFVGTTKAFPSLSWLSRTEDDALAGIRALVAEVTDDITSEHAEELHSDCAFCMGIRAFERGKSEEDNPFPAPENTSRDEVYETDHFLWGMGYASADPSRFGTPYRRSEHG